jgi:hypothetical protein
MNRERNTFVSQGRQRFFGNEVLAGLENMTREATHQEANCFLLRLPVGKVIVTITSSSKTSSKLL